MTHKEMFENAKRRPLNWFDLSPQEHWDIDKRLGILDWDGPKTIEEQKELEEIYCKKKKRNKNEKDKKVKRTKNS